MAIHHCLVFYWFLSQSYIFLPVGGILLFLFLFLHAFFLHCGKGAVTVYSKYIREVKTNDLFKIFFKKILMKCQLLHVLKNGLLFQERGLSGLNYFSLLLSAPSDSLKRVHNWNCPKVVLKTIWHFTVNQSKRAWSNSNWLIYFWIRCRYENMIHRSYTRTYKKRQNN